MTKSQSMSANFTGDLPPPRARQSSMPMNETATALGWLFFLCFILLPAAAAQEPVHGAASLPLPPGGLQMTLFAKGFWRPHTAAHAGDGSQRFYVAEQTGRIWLIRDKRFRATAPFLDISRLTWAAQFELGKFYEPGLLGLVFHPNYQDNGWLYVNYVDGGLVTRVVRYTAADDRRTADPASAREILSLKQIDPDHNGGKMAFGPDGYLYISIGDGGLSNEGDPLGMGQNRQTLFGSILRIDVDSEEPYAVPADNPFVNDAAALDEIWAYGLRNAWGMSFDTQTGDLYIADVGRRLREEVNFQPANSAGGENYGWNFWEGTHEFAGGEAQNHVAPVIEYDHSQGCAVIGGAVYRGSAISHLHGVYIYGDYCSGAIWGAWRNEAGSWRSAKLLKCDCEYLSGFGTDEAGEIYVIDYGGKIYRIDAAPGE